MAATRHHRKSFNKPGHAHELTFSCYRKYPFLGKERVQQWLCESIKDGYRDLEYALWAYVFMPDHVHLIMKPLQNDYDISEFLSRVKSSVSRKALAFLRKQAPDWMEKLKAERGDRTEYHFWQRGGGYDRNITEPGTLLRMIDYVHMNPVRKGLVEQASDWKWSSAGWYAGMTPNTLEPDPIPPEWTIA